MKNLNVHTIPCGLILCNQEIMVLVCELKRPKL